jgi:hypothetical protein
MARPATESRASSSTVRKSNSTVTSSSLPAHACVCACVCMRACGRHLLGLPLRMAGRKTIYLYTFIYNSHIHTYKFHMQRDLPGLPVRLAGRMKFCACVRACVRVRVFQRFCVKGCVCAVAQTHRTSLNRWGREEHPI